MLMKSERLGFMFRTSKAYVLIKLAYLLRQVTPYRLLVVLSLANMIIILDYLNKNAPVIDDDASELKTVNRTVSTISKIVFTKSFWKPDLNCQVIQLGNVTNSPVTTVSVYFTFDRSKHTRQEYDKWQEYFFSSATSTPLVIFADKASIFDLMYHASRSANPKTFYVFDEIWDITRLIELDRNVSGRYVDNYKNVQRSIDPESRFHSPELYAVWNAKSFLMKYVSSGPNNIYGSAFFLYSDIGAFRSEAFPEWPDVDHVMQICAGLKDRVLFSQVRDSVADPYDARSEFIEGGFFAGSPKALDFFYTKFYEMHDEFLDLGLFIGKDQMLMNVMVKVRHADRICKLWLEPFRIQCLPKKDAWFVYQDYLAPPPIKVTINRIDTNDNFFIVSSLTSVSAFWPNRSRLYEIDVNQFCQINKLYQLPLDSITCNHGTETISVKKCRVCYFNATDYKVEN